MQVYEPDYEWLWDPATFEKQAKLRAHVFSEHHDQTLRATGKMLGNLADFGNGCFGRGGWGIRLLKVTNPPITEELSENCAKSYAFSLEVTSGGQDVADAIIDAAEEIFATLSAIPDTDIQWEQIPR